jgi:hypothetical protein
MDRVLQLVADYQFGIYGVLGLVLVFYLRRAILARRETARSIFKLEQEQARGRYGRSVGISAFILLLVVATFLVSNPLVPGPAASPSPTPTMTTGPLVAPTLTPTLLPPTLTPTSRPTPVTPTPILKPTATRGVVPTSPPAVIAPACPNPNARITSPGVNQVLTGNVAVRGTANIADFDYYKIELAPGANPGDGAWQVVGDLHRAPVSAGVLMSLNAGSFSPGTYSLRLVVVDKTGNYPDPCRVTVSIQH